MKCTPQNTMYSASVWEASLREPQRIARQIGVLVHVSALIVVAEYDGTLAQGTLGCDDARLALVRSSGLKRSKVIVLTSISSVLFPKALKR